MGDFHSICSSSVVVATGGIPAALFLAGLAGGFTHCAGMCGPFMLGLQSNTRHECSQAHFARAALPYHAGRITTYMLLGVAASFFAEKFTLFLKAGWLPSLLLVLGGLLLLVQLFGLNLTVPVSLLPPGAQKLLGWLTRGGSAWHQYGAGLLLGFLPCGLLLSALMVAASTPSMMVAAFGMLAFGAATLPGLSLVGLLGHVFLKKNPAMAPALRKGLGLASAGILFLLAGVRFT